MTVAASERTVVVAVVVALIMSMATLRRINLCPFLSSEKAAFVHVVPAVVVAPAVVAVWITVT